MDLSTLLRELSIIGVRLSVKDRNISCQGNVDYLTEEIISGIKKHKLRLISVLRVENPLEVIRSRPHLDPSVCSYAQHRVWMAEKLGSDASYIVPRVFFIDGTVDFEALDRAFYLLQKRHSLLMCRFREVGREVTFETSKHFEHIRSISANSKEKALALIDTYAKQTFNLAEENPIRAFFISVSATSHWLLLSVHHIVTDGWSMGILYRDLSALYAREINLNSESLPQLSVEYADYVDWQNQPTQKAIYETELIYWGEQLKGIPQMHSLPLDHPRPAVSNFAGAVFQITTSKALHQRLEALASAQQVTLFMVLQTAFALLVNRWSWESDIVMGTPIAGRNSSELTQLVGFFVNTLILRSHIQPNLSFAEQLVVNKQMILEAYNYQTVPFEQIVEGLKPDRHLSHNALFQIMFALQSNETPALTLGTTPMRADHLKIDSSKFDLTLNAGVDEEGLHFAWEYATAILTKTTVERLAKSFLVLLDQIVSFPERSQQDYSIWYDLDDIPYKKLIEKEYPRNQDIWSIFEETVVNYGEQIAWIDEEMTLSYNELYQQAKSLAHTLKTEGVLPGEGVGVALPRSKEFVISALAILSVGGFYVPLDPGYPAERIQFMIQDSQVSLVITDKDGYDNSSDTRSLNIHEHDVNNSAAFLPNRSQANTPAYLMYTSGSTGDPKGVLVPHRAVIRLVKNTNYVSFSKDTVVAHGSNLSFDAATFEIWGALLNGGKLVLISQDQLLDPQKLEKKLKDHNVTTQVFTTQLFNRIAHIRPSTFQTLRDCLVGGEAISTSAVKAVMDDKPPKRIINGYGPTENTTFSCYYEITKDALDSFIPIGTPLVNSGAYVVDRLQKLTAPGALGELVVTGDGLAIGYWGNSQLTEQKFITLVDGQRGYRTGDLVRWSANNQLEYRGRIDNQVKVRGYRIEPNEVSVQLCKIEEIQQATVVVQERNGEKVLVAYVVPANRLSKEAFVKDIRQQVALKLPQHMRPAYYVVVEKLPLTPNGKLDVSKLPKIETEFNQEPHYHLSDTEEQVKECFEEVLNQSHISPEADFFDLGGHSLIAMELINKLNKILGTNLKFSDIFKYSTIISLSGEIDKQTIYDAVGEDVKDLMEELDDDIASLFRDL